MPTAARQTFHCQTQANIKVCRNGERLESRPSSSTGAISARRFGTRCCSRDQCWVAKLSNAKCSFRQEMMQWICKIAIHTNHKKKRSRPVSRSHTGRLREGRAGSRRQRPLNKCQRSIGTRSTDYQLGHLCPGANYRWFALARRDQSILKRETIAAN